MRRLILSATCLLFALSAVVGYLAWRGSRADRLHAELKAHGLRGGVMIDNWFPAVLQRQLPERMLRPFYPLCGVHFESLPAEVRDVDFLADYPELEYALFVRGTIHPGVIRSLQALPKLRQLNLHGGPKLDGFAILQECRQLRTLRQLTILGVDDVFEEAVVAFERDRPDVYVGLGRGKRSKK